MRPVIVVWLISLFSLTSLSAVGQASQFSQAGTPVPFDGYWELVRNTRQAVVQMEAESGESVRARLDDLASQWEDVTAVELSDQSVVQVDSSYLVAELQRDPTDLPRLKKLLQSLLDANEQYPQKVFTLQDVEPLQSILARPEFQWAEARTVELPKWLQNLVDGFFNLMERIALRLQNTAYYGRVPLILAAALLFALSLVYISRNLSRNLVRDAQLAAEGGDGDEMLTSRGAMQRAQTLSGKGDYRSAIRYLYLSSLLALDEQGLLRYDRSRTNREYLRSVSAKPGVAVPLRDVIDVFDRVWYGFESVDEQAYRSYVERVDELRERKE